jgi:hypothetical protein
MTAQHLQMQQQQRTMKSEQDSMSAGAAAAVHPVLHGLVDSHEDGRRRRNT